jgi:cytochrome P450
VTDVQEQETFDDFLQRFDHTSPEYAKDPAKALGRLRSECPVAHVNVQGGLWILTRYQEVAEAARNDARYSSEWRADGSRKGVSASPKPHRSGFIDMDPPESLKYRKIVNSAFTKPAVAKIAHAIRETAHSSIDDFIERGAADFVSDYAEVIAATTTMRIVGVPTGNWREYVHYFHESSGVPSDAPGYAERHGPDNFVITNMRELLRQRQLEPQDDCLSRFVTDDTDGAPISIDTAAECATLLLNGGLDTTAALLSNALLYLCQHERDRHRLINNPADLAPACEEFIRYFTPVQNLCRTATESHELGGVTIEAGERVMLSWASANRDEREFANPDTVDIGRFPNRHQGFGLGTHRCVGSSLAREMFIIGMGAFLERIPDYIVKVEQARKYASLGSNNGWLSMPIEFAPGSRRDTGQRRALSR